MKTFERNPEYSKYTSDGNGYNPRWKGVDIVDRLAKCVDDVNQSPEEKDRAAACLKLCIEFDEEIAHGGRPESSTFNHYWVEWLWERPDQFEVCEEKTESDGVVRRWIRAIRPDKPEVVSQVTKSEKVIFPFRPEKTESAEAPEEPRTMSLTERYSPKEVQRRVDMIIAEAKKLNSGQSKSCSREE